jgi:DNA-binding CsgD family transcriptional regulator
MEHTRPSAGWESLTRRERDVVQLAADGLTNPEIAAHIAISRGTVKVHLSNVYAKLGLRNRSELAGEVARRQILEAVTRERGRLAGRGSK